MLTKDSRTCLAYPSGRGTYEIHDGKARLLVSINARTCICGKWQISGIPCKHGIRAILADGKDLVDYVSEWFTVARYKQAYQGNIAPVPDPEQWPQIADVPTLVPPTMKRSVGRPSRNRRREEGEVQKRKRSTTVRCNKCKEIGHNALKCKGGLKAKEKAQQQENTTQQPKKGKKRKSDLQPTYGVDPNAMNLIEMMIEGTHDQWVDPNNEAEGTTVGECSNAQNQANLISVHPTTSQPSKKSKRSKRNNNNESREPDLISLMMESSQQQSTVTQPPLSPRNLTQSSQAAPNLSGSVSPKVAKILKRLSQLN